ncbi:MAG: NAD(P)/FAD-dependent oxidoreductase [Methylocapsa sp.]|nr:NAD(P)/FAD-dependent oxidoreductase [Methylocapsa sp.]
MPHVVIVGAGFGGLEAAKALASSQAEVIIIDCHNHHSFQPLLYQVATAALSAADIAWPIRAMFRKRRNVRVVLARVEAIDHKKKIVRTNSLSIHYDYLIVATGATHFYFGHEEWERFAPGLKSLEDAARIRDRILMAFEQAELAEDDSALKELMTFVIVGGGPTGVEMAGAIAEMAQHSLCSDFRRIDPAAARIILLEAGPRILPSFPERLSRYAMKALRHMGVEARVSARVTVCDARGVIAGKERINASTVIWAAGVTASPAADWLGAGRDKNGRVIVSPDLSLPGKANVFVIGDTASVIDSNTGAPVPGMAPGAKQMGRFAGKLIAAEINGRKTRPTFRYRNYGELAAIGRKAAIVKIGRLELTGFAGWLVWAVAHIYFLIGVRNRFVVAFNWLWSYLTYQRGARLITPEP